MASPPADPAMTPARKKKGPLLPEALNPLSYVPNTLNPVHQLRVMRRFVRRQAKKPGLPPGTVVHTGAKKVEQGIIGRVNRACSALCNNLLDNIAVHVSQTIVAAGMTIG